MALTKPILNPVSAFDVHIGYRFTFQVIGGDKVTGCKLSIFDNATGVLLYVDTQMRESFYFDLPADADVDLVNGGNYNVYIQTIGDSGESVPSSRMQFYCFATPLFRFVGNEPTITSATNTWYVEHIADTDPPYDGEPIDTLKQYTFILYNSDGSQAQTSGTLFFASRPDLNYTFSGLLNGATYKIKVIAETTNGMSLATSEYTINVVYDLPTPDGAISATNFCNQGDIVVQIDISQVANVEDYQYARIYRRDIYNDTSWLLLIENYVTNLQGGIYVHTDNYNRYGVQYEYALALVKFNGVESEYITCLVDNEENDGVSRFDGIFLVDLNTKYKIFANPQYGGTTSVQKVGIHEPIGSQYPILVYNATTNYQRGSVTAAVLSQEYELHRVLDEFSITQQMHTLDNFLKNKSAKILKDWNGNIWLCSIVGEPSISYNNSSGMNYVECTFEWIEQGKADNYNDLYNNGLISNLPPISVKFTGLNGTVVSLSNSNGDMLNAIIGETGETIVTTYNVGAYSGTATLSNDFGTQTVSISKTVEGGVVNVVDIPYYNLTIDGDSTVYDATPIIHLENSGTELDTVLTNSVVIPIIQTGTWSGYALAYTNQKQPITATITNADATITVGGASTLTINTVSNVSYTLSNTNGGYTNTISGSGSGIYKLFTTGTWAGNSTAIGSQIVSESVDISSYLGDYTLDIESAILKFEVTARLDNSVPMSISNTGSTILNTFTTTNGDWATCSSKLSTNTLRDIEYGNGYWVTCNGTSFIAYSTSLTSGTWTNIELTNSSIIKVVYGNAYWVAVDTVGKIWYRSSTPNGTWTAVSLNISYGISDVHYANGYWVATIGQGAELPPSNEAGIYYRASTPNGAWTFQNISTSTSIEGLYYGNSYWVCIDVEKKGFWYRSSTPNGTWTLKTLTISGVTNPYPRNITYGNGYWAIVDSTNNGIYYTSGALSSTWSGYTDASQTYIPLNSLRQILYTNGYWVISYDTGNASTSGVLYRYNDINPANGFADLIKQIISNAAGGVLLYTSELLVVSGNTYYTTAPAPFFGYNNRILSHTFPITQPSLQSATYTIIKSGAWSGTGVIDNYTKSLSVNPTLTAEGTNTYTLDIKDKGIT